MMGLGGALVAGMVIGPLTDTWITRRLAEIGLERSGVGRRARRWVLTGVLALGWLLAVRLVGWSGLLPAHLAWVTITAALVITDLEHRLIPNRILYPGTGITAVLLTLGALLEGTPGRLGGAVTAAALCMVGMGILAAAARGAMGMGDVKLSALLGLVCGYHGVPTAFLGILWGFVIGGVAALALLVLRRAHRHTQIPFAPALVAGAWLSLL